MFWRTVTAAGLATALVLAPAEEVQADAGDFIGGAIVGGLIGHAITKDQQRQRSTVRRRSTSTRTYRPRIPITEHGRQTQTALNYFGFNAGRVDGQIGSGTRRAIERYQASMNYPINGSDFQPYQFDTLMQAYYWAVNGGAVQTRLNGQPLLQAYRQQTQGGATVAVAPAPVPLPVQPGTVTNVIVPVPATPVQPAPPTPQANVIEVKEEAPETSSLPNLFAGSASSVSLANRCNSVQLQTSTNGGFTTLASLADADFAMSEQFCLARGYAIARGEELMQKIQGLSTAQIAEQCKSFGDMLSAQVDAISLRPQAEAEAKMREFALGTGIPPSDLAATSRVCLGIGYAQDDMGVALGAALMLVTLGEPAYGELIGHHLREGVGTTRRNDLAVQWYTTSLDALDNGAQAAFMPSQAERPALIRAAMMSLSPDVKGAVDTAPAQAQETALPTFTVAE